MLGRSIKTFFANDRREHLYYVIAVIVWIAIFGLTAVIAERTKISYHHQIKQNLIRESTHIKSQLKNELLDHAQSLQRIAKRWEISNGTPQPLWESNAATFIKQNPSIQAIEWVDPQYTIRWVVPLKGNEQALNLNLAFEEKRQQALEHAKASQHTILSSPIDLVQGGKGLLIYVPMYGRQQTFLGFTLGVYRIQTLLDTALTLKDRHHYALSLDHHHQRFYHNRAADPKHSRWCIRSPLDLFGQQWHITTCPTNAYLKHIGNHAATDVWLMGLFLASLLASLFVLLGRVTLRNRDNEHQRTLLNLIYQITLTARQQTTEKAALQAVLSLICDTLNWPVGHAYRLKVEDNKALLIPSDIWHDTIEKDISEFKQVTANTTFEYGIGLPGRVWLSRQTEWIQDVCKDSNFPRAAHCQHINLCSAIGIPIYYEGKLEYVLEFFTHNRLDFSQEVIDSFNYISEGLNQVWQNIRTEQAIRNLEQRNQLLLNSAAEGIYGLDKNGKTTFVNPAAQDMLGYNASELVGQHMHSLIHNKHQDGSEYPADECPMYDTVNTGTPHQIENEVLWRKDGSYFYVSYHSTPMHFQGELIGAVITFNDTTAQVEAAKKMKKLALFDFLTGFYNRAHFETLLQKATKRCQRRQLQLALFYFDIDHFKSINDSLGHDAGDQLLEQFAQRMRAVVRENETLGRIGGDEFALISEEIESREAVIAQAERLIEAMKAPFSINQQPIQVTTSVGVALYPQDGDTPQQLAKSADVALYHAKDLGRNQFQIYTQDLQASHMRQLELDTNILKAIEHNEFFLEFQPQVIMPNNQLFGLEALIRWQHPEHGTLYPGEFLPKAEETGKIQAIDLWVVEQTLVAFQQLPTEIQRNLLISFNLSANSINDSTQMQKLVRLLDAAKIPAKHIGIEITEGSLGQENLSTIAALEKLCHCGYQIIIDDFGIEHSSLSRLSRLPITMLKIDSTFTRNITESDKDTKIVQSIISLAKELELTILAEGIETQEQLDMLVESGCYIIQGFYTGKPACLNTLSDPNQLPWDINID